MQEKLEKKFWQLQFRFIINHLMKHMFKTYWPFSVPAGLGLLQQFPNEILHFRLLCYLMVHGRTHYWKNTRFRLLFLPVVFSLRPTAAQNRKKRKHQKAIYDQLNTKLRYSIVRFFFYLPSIYHFWLWHVRHNELNKIIKSRLNL